MDETYLYLLGIATRYGMEGTGFEPQWEQFSPLHTRLERPWGPPSLLYNRYRGVTMNTTPSTEEIKERVKLYLYLHSACMECSGKIFIFYTSCIVLSTEEFLWYFLARNFKTVADCH